MDGLIVLVVVLAALAVPFALGRFVEKLWMSLLLLLPLPVFIAIGGLASYSSDTHSRDEDVRMWAAAWLLLPIFAVVAYVTAAFVCWIGWRTAGGGKKRRPRRSKTRTTPVRGDARREWSA